MILVVSGINRYLTNKKVEKEDGFYLKAIFSTLKSYTVCFSIEYCRKNFGP
jgi:hypothetical protein